MDGTDEAGFRRRAKTTTNRRPASGDRRALNAAADFAGTPAAVAQSRGFVERLIDDADDETRHDVLLVVSELASNAVRHAGSGFTLEIEHAGDQIRITVTDRGDGAPESQRPSPSDPSGRGLLIVESLAEDWGVTEHDTGKSVWATLRSSATARQAPSDR